MKKLIAAGAFVLALSISPVAPPAVATSAPAPTMVAGGCWFC